MKDEKRQPFSKQEDDLLMMYGKKIPWVQLSLMFVDRSDDSLRNRWSRLNPQAPKNKVKQNLLAKGRTFFNKEEDAFILSFVNAHGKKWVDLSTAFSARFRSTTASNTRNRWCRLYRRDQKMEKLTDSLNEEALDFPSLQMEELEELNVDDWFGIV